MVLQHCAARSTPDAQLSISCAITSREHKSRGAGQWTGQEEREEATPIQAEAPPICAEQLDTWRRKTAPITESQPLRQEDITLSHPIDAREKFTSFDKTFTSVVNTHSAFNMTQAGVSKEMNIEQLSGPENGLLKWKWEGEGDRVRRRDVNQREWEERHRSDERGRKRRQDEVYIWNKSSSVSSNLRGSRRWAHAVTGTEVLLHPQLTARKCFTV